MTSFHRSLRAALAAALVFAASPIGLAHGGPPAAAAPDAAKIEEAKKHMAAGAALYNDPSGHKCEEAYVEFNKAYELSGSLNALKNRAVCALELEKDGEALLDYKKVLAGMADKLAPDEKAQIENDMKALEAAVAWVTIKIDVPKVKIVDVRTPSRGLPVNNRYDAIVTGTKIGFHPGEHALTATTEDGKELTWKVELTNGSTQDHAFEFSKIVTAPTVTATATVAPTVTVAPTGTVAPTATTTATAEMTRPVPTSVKVLAGLTGALAIGTGVMMGLAGSAASDFKKDCTPVSGTSKCTNNGTLSDKDLTAKRNNVVLMNGIADGLLGGTVLAAGATLVLFLIRPSVPAEGSTKTGFYIAPAVTPSAGGAVVGGRF